MGQEIDKKEKERAQNELKRHPYQLSIWLRLMNFVIGLLFLILPGYLLLNEELVNKTVVTLFALVILFSGLSRMINAFYDESIGGTRRIGRFVIGGILITLSFLVYLLDEESSKVILALVASGLFLQGLSRLSVGMVHEVFPGWLKLELVIIGLLAVLIGGFSLLALGISGVDLEDATFVNLLAIGFFFGGIARISLSIAGLSIGKAD